MCVRERVFECVCACEREGVCVCVCVCERAILYKIKTFESKLPD